ncbi:MAG: hypothetical protein ICV56_06760 [Nitrososphaeraceae archaeon]|nr:hypothetical protein [Nitrososphaeraceae archaeon]
MGPPNFKFGGCLKPLFPLVTGREQKTVFQLKLLPSALLDKLRKQEKDNKKQKLRNACGIKIVSESA